MYLYSVIPFSNLPRPASQKPVYYSVEKFDVGQIVEIPLGRRRVFGVIRNRASASKNKQNIKKLGYSLKKIQQAKTTKPVFEEEFLQLVEDIAEYYFESVGLVLERALPFSMTKPTKPTFQTLEKAEARSLNRGKAVKNLVINNNPNAFYKKNNALKTETIFISAEYAELSKLQTSLPSPAKTIKNSAKKTDLRNMWLEARNGKVTHIAGTRSALFMPVNNLKNLVVENENSNSHKSWDQHPKIDTRTVAQEMSDAYNLNLFTRDSLPSVETFWQAKQGNWKISKEVSSAPKPVIIDMREELKKNRRSPLSRQTEELVKEIKTKEKALLFVNRRGLSSAILCRSCGYAVKCPECEIPMVLHMRALVCHKCGQKKLPPKNCIKCKSYKIKEIGGGTQKIVKEIKELAPHLKVCRIDSDIAPTPQKQELILDSFSRGEFQVLVGTQAALKERLLPELDKAAVLMVDNILNLPTHQSSPQAFEIIWRLKHKTSNPVVVQTYHPELPVFSYAQKNNFEDFYEYELEKRKALFLPPYSQIIKLRYSHRDSRIAEREALSTKRKLETVVLRMHNADSQRTQPRIMGPAPAFVPKIKNKYIWQIFIRWPRQKNGKIKSLEARNDMLNTIPRGWDIDVDPVDIL